MLTLTLTACPMLDKGPSKEPSTRGLDEVYDSVYLPVDRTTAPPAGYGLYTVVLTRTANPNTTRVMAELFATTGSASNAAIKRENLNLITIPVKDAGEADRALASARFENDATATAVMQKHYDFDLAALLMSSVCRPARGTAVMEVCGSTAPDGPLLVTSQRPLGGSIPNGEKLLIVNLSTTPAGAIPEVLAAYREQILRKDYADRVELDSWRLWALNQVLETARLLPRIKKAYAGLVSP
jgi:hypothetical protein